MVNSPLPAPSSAIRNSYQKLVLEIDNHVKELAASRFEGKLHCGPECSSCCISFSVLPLEASVIFEELVDHRRIPANGKGQCTLLVDNLCLVYDRRPILCRTQGVPNAYIDESSESIEVSACPLNFPDDYPLDHEDLLFLDQFNKRLAELNMRYCRSAGIVPGTRIPIKTIVSSR